MHTELHVHRFQARHCVADETGRHCAQAVQQTLLAGELEAALAATVPADEIVLVRRLAVRVVIDPRRSERENARRWSDALALGLTRHLQHARDPELLRFASRPQARLAFVQALLQGDTTHDWAWQRLAWLPGVAPAAVGAGARRQALLHLLADTPDEGVPLLRRLVAGALWPLLIAHLADGELRGLAQAVAAQIAGGSTGFDEGLAPAAHAATSTVTAAHPADAEPPQVAATRRAAASPERQRWALRLLAMLLQPALVRRGVAAVDTQVLRWHRVLADGPATAHTPPGDSATATDSAPARAPAQPSAAARSPGQSAAPAPAVETEAAAIGYTEHGGLLLLLPLLPACGALPLLEDTAVWGDQPLPAVLHRLALTLAPVSADDAAALAFCGQPPGAPPPDPADLDPAQGEALARTRDRLREHLAQRLPQWPPAALLPRIVQRRARLSADPGWITVHYALADVSLDLRRAALDLDPGFLPWLGAVLSYRYE